MTRNFCMLAHVLKNKNSRNPSTRSFYKSHTDAFSAVISNPVSISVAVPPPTTRSRYGTSCMFCRAKVGRHGIRPARSVITVATVPRGDPGLKTCREPFVTGRATVSPEVGCIIRPLVAWAERTRVASGPHRVGVRSIRFLPLYICSVHLPRSLPSECHRAR